MHVCVLQEIPRSHLPDPPFRPAGAVTRPPRWHQKRSCPEHGHGPVRFTNAVWQELVDPTTNNTYYYNGVTNESSWTSPPGFAAPITNMSQQSIVSSTVVQKPQTFDLQVTTFIHSTSATQSSGAACA